MVFMKSFSDISRKVEVRIVSVEVRVYQFYENIFYIDRDLSSIAN